MDLTLMITFANAGFLLLMIALMMAGYKNGLVLSLLNCLGWIAAMVAAYLFSPAAAQALTIYPLSLTPMNETAFGPVFQQMLNQLLWFVVIAAVVKLICLILKPIAKMFVKIPVLGFFNRVAGALFGIVNMWIWTSIICLVLSLPVFDWGKDVIDGSLLKSASLVSDLIAEKIQLETEDVDQIMKLMSQIQNMDEQSIEQIRDAFEQMGITQAQIDELFEKME